VAAEAAMVAAEGATAEVAVVAATEGRFESDQTIVVIE